MSVYFDESIPYGPIQVIMIVLDHKTEPINQPIKSSILQQNQSTTISLSHNVGVI